MYDTTTNTAQATAQVLFETFTVVLMSRVKLWK
jgi:hypothetical protein